MNKNFKLICAAAASLLATAAQAAVLTLTPAGISGQPGDTTGWGFTLLNDDAANYLLVTGTDFTLAPPSAFGSYADLLGSRFAVLAPGASLSEAYDGGLGTGIGQFSFDAAANGRLDGQVNLYYALFSVDPNDASFDPGVHTVTFDASAFALASVQAVPEPSTWSLFGIAGLLALSRRRALSSSRSNA